MPCYDSYSLYDLHLHPPSAVLIGSGLIYRTLKVWAAAFPLLFLPKPGTLIRSVVHILVQLHIYRLVISVQKSVDCALERTSGACFWCPVGPVKICNYKVAKL